MVRILSLLLSYIVFWCLLDTLHAFDSVAIVQRRLTAPPYVSYSYSYSTRCRGWLPPRPRGVIAPADGATRREIRSQSVRCQSNRNADLDGSDRGNNNHRLTRFMQQLMTLPLRLWARFQLLSNKAKRIVVANLFMVTVTCGFVATRAYQTHAVSSRPLEIAYSSFLDLVDQQQRSKNDPVIDRVRIGNDRISFRIYRERHSPSNKAKATSSSSSSPFVTAYTQKVSASQELVNTLRKSDITFAAAPQPRTSVVGLAVRSFLLTFYFVILWRLYRTISGATGTRSGDAPGKLAKASDLPLASFEDIQGIDDAKHEVMELVDTLRFPDKYAVLGARAPTGLLLEGPPGTGKTMLARATAASAGVPLLYCSGSDFVEMYVGRGAARVRKLFERASRLSPCIIFIDELDALGKARDVTGGLGVRSNDEAEQTLNQLLACMDGLDSSRRICVLAATNRKDVLDSALVRPGRFDRIVKLRLPDAVGRERILRVHCRKLPGFKEGSGVDPARPGALGKGRVVDLSAIAVLTDGFSGAELEFLVNEAAIRAVRRVSAALRQGIASTDITPHVEASDFEASLANFYETRKPKNPWTNVFK